jgi:hypothetical protein
MSRKMIVLVLAAVSFGLSNCASEENTDKPAAAAASPTPAIEIIYSKGFYDLERDPSGSWRWMGQEGLVKLKNTRREMRLRLSGRSPIEQYRPAQVITITLNGKQLDQLTASKELVDKEYTISADGQGSDDWLDLRITSDKSFVPKEVDKRSADGRRLAFSLMKLTWEPK